MPFDSSLVFGAGHFFLLYLIPTYHRTLTDFPSTVPTLSTYPRFHRLHFSTSPSVVPPRIQVASSCFTAGLGFWNGDCCLGIFCNWDCWNLLYRSCERRSLQDGGTLSATCFYKCIIVDLGGSNTGHKSLANESLLCLRRGYRVRGTNCTFCDRT